MTQRRFSRRVEDFTCEHCGTRVEGDGYTNHCPRCLWSRHVDVNPGDRASPCGGMMRPTHVTMKHQAYVVHHECVACGFTRSNRINEGDDFDAVIKLASKRS
ncbi:MAG TPA: RNHCP domain-containing protein [Dongiaceae bacterium]|jgi:ribosomal protein L37E|nr:RNHCP domain-containing protein [Dongiaceae bacterium]